MYKLKTTQNDNSVLEFIEAGILFISGKCSFFKKS